MSYPCLTNVECAATPMCSDIYLIPIGFLSFSHQQAKISGVLKFVYFCNLLFDDFE